MSRAGRRLRGQSGFTIVELLVAMTLGLVVVGIGVTVFTAAGRGQPAEIKRGEAVQDGRTTMDRIIREIRQGSTIFSASASQLSLLTYVDSATCGGAGSSTAIQCRVTYTCSSGTCDRVESAPPPGTETGPSVRMVTGLSSSNIFGYGTGCSSTGSLTAGYICVKLVFPSENGDDAITLEDGATPLNPTA